MTTFEALPDKFLDRVYFEPNSGCWLWAAGIASSSGYGRFYIDGRTQAAHRVSYQLVKGIVPEGLEIDHLCRVRSCVNPDHLEAVTHLENVRRGSGGAHAINLAKTHCPQGHAYAGENLYFEPLTGARQCKKCRRSALMRFRSRHRNNSE